MLVTKLYKIKEGKEVQWRAWCTEIKTTYRNEALKTIAEEKNVFEIFSLLKLGYSYYTLGIAEGRFEKVDAKNELNILHKKNKDECLGEEVALEMLYSLEVQ